MFPSLACPVGCAECKEDNDKIVCEDNKCLSTHIQVAASKSECVGEWQCVLLYTECVTLYRDFVASPSPDVLVIVTCVLLYTECVTLY